VQFFREGARRIMPGMNIALWLEIAILAYSVIVTLITDWIAVSFRRVRLRPKLTLRSFIDIVASLVWVVLLYVFGVLAIRYIERMPSAVVGYAAFAVSGFLLSLGRAYLYRRVQERRKPEQRIDWKRLVPNLIHNSSYLLSTLVLFLALCWLRGVPAAPILFIPLFIGAILPDLDSRESLPGRLIPWIPKWLEVHFGHLEEWHTPAAAALVALISAPLIPLIGVQAWYLVPFGFLSHLLFDLLAPQGIMLFWPLSRTRYGVFEGVIQSPGCRAERLLTAGLAFIAILLLFVVDLGAAKPTPTPAPSYQQTLDRYYSMRGINQVFAYIDGSWQLSGQPIRGWFEILNASGDTYIVLDRFTGEIFTAGQGASDNVYANRIVLQTGPTVLVKSVESHLENQALADALGIVYEMQAEPGLLHIYATGSVLPVPQAGEGLALQQDYSLTTLQKIQAQQDGSFRLYYLSAAELIQLANLRVELGDLIITATYARPASGPTATPLPPLPVDEEPEGSLPQNKQ
jgi:membrane-bound metal-dependent hydrolase YbcI (DUF457 family)